MTYALILKADGSTDEVAEKPPPDSSGQGELDMLYPIVSEGADPNHHPIVQMIWLEYGAVGFCHEEGLYAGPGGRPLPRNELGTELLHRAGGQVHDYIKGSFVLLGNPDDEGYSTAVPQAMIDAVERRLSTGKWPEVAA